MDITLPYNFDLAKCPYLWPFFSATQRFRIAVIHRRGRKSRAALSQQITRTQQKRGVYYYVLPTYKQAKQVIWDELIHDHLPMEIVAKKNDSELAIYYKNGSIQRFVGSEEPDKHRGVNAIDWVFDEYSEQKPAMWTDIAQPILRENGGTATWCFTPKGRNHAWKLLQHAKEHPDEWFTLILPADKTGVFSTSDLEKIRTSGEIPDAIFQQEYMCEFLDGATSFFRRILENVYIFPPEFKASHQFQIGVDLAKYMDFTVITPFDLVNYHVLPQDRFNQVDWNLQKARIEIAWRKHNSGLVQVDGTGVGDPIVEDLEAKGIRVESFKFTDQSRKDLLTNLAVLLEQDKIKIPDDPGLITELQGFQWVLKENGKLTVQSTETHDDRVMSLALAVWNVPKEPYSSTGTNELMEKFDKWSIV